MRDCSCEEIEPLLVLSLYGELENEEEEVLDLHLSKCPSCREVLEQHRKVLGLDGEIETEPLRPLSFETGGTQKKRLPVRDIRRFLIPMGFRAAALLIAGISLWIVMGREGEDPSGPQKNQIAQQHDVENEFDPFKPIELKRSWKDSSFRLNPGKKTLAFTKFKKRVNDLKSMSF